MSEVELYDFIQVGDKYKLYYSDGHYANKLMHIRAKVDGEEIVYKYWSRYKQRWIYVVESGYMFWLWYTDGRITIRK